MSYEYDYHGNRYRSAYNYNGQKLGKSTPATLNAVGEEVLANAKSTIAKFAEPNALIIGYISDIHRSTTTYHGDVIDDTGTLHLLSRLADEVDMSCVFVGGDIANAVTSEETTDTIRSNQQSVIDDLDEILPYTNIFATIGNHDKKYSAQSALNTNEYFRDLYDVFQENGNGVELHYIDDTNYYIDFTKQKIRIIVANQYDAVDDDPTLTASATHCTWSWASALNFEVPKRASEWLVGVVFHGMDFTGVKDIMEAYKNGTSAEHYTNTNGEAGKGYLGSFVGHLHGYAFEQAFEVPKRANGINSIWTTCAYALGTQMGTADEYGFAVYIINPSGLHHQIRIGRDANEVPFGTVNNNSGLLENGTCSVDASYSRFYCIRNGNHVRFDRIWNLIIGGMNFTNLAKEWGYWGNDFVTSDTDNVLFSAHAGDVIKTEIIFSEDTDTTNRSFAIFSPQISDMVTGTVVKGKTYTKEITLSADTDITAIGMSYRGQSADGIGIMDFILNVDVNGQRITQRT